MIHVVTQRFHIGIRPVKAVLPELLARELLDYVAITVKK